MSKLIHAPKNAKGGLPRRIFSHLIAPQKTWCGHAASGLNSPALPFLGVNRVEEAAAISLARIIRVKGMAVPSSRPHTCMLLNLIENEEEEKGRNRAWMAIWPGNLPKTVTTEFRLRLLNWYATYGRGGNAGAGQKKRAFSME